MILIFFIFPISKQVLRILLLTISKVFKELLQIKANKTDFLTSSIITLEQCYFNFFILIYFLYNKKHDKINYLNTEKLYL